MLSHSNTSVTNCDKREISKRYTSPNYSSIYTFTVCFIEREREKKTSQDGACFSKENLGFCKDVLMARSSNSSEIFVQARTYLTDVFDVEIDILATIRTVNTMAKDPTPVHRP